VQAQEPVLLGHRLLQVALPGNSSAAAAGMNPQGWPGAGAPVANPQSAVGMQQAQMQAMQAMQRGYAAGAMYPGYAAQQMPPMGQGQGSSSQAPGPATHGVPGGGAPDGGLSAAYAAWVAAYGASGFGPATSGGYPGPAPRANGSASGCQADGPSKGRGGGKGKGKGRGFKGGAPPESRRDAAAMGSDPRRQIEMAQRRAKQRDRSAISQAQRSAQQRFERDLLSRVQGYWADASESGTSYAVEGSLCSVSTSDSSRVFRNRISVFNGELCWDARRFWHYLNLSSLPPTGEQVERVEWAPGEGSPPTRPIVWIRTEAPPPKMKDNVAEGQAEDELDEEDDDDEQELDQPKGVNGAKGPSDEAAVSMAEAVAEAAVA